jgi:hypothetical protein
VDSRAATVDVTIHGLDFVIHQSPSLLSSTRAGGTTGAGERFLFSFLFLYFLFIFYHTHTHTDIYIYINIFKMDP